MERAHGTPTSAPSWLDRPASVGHPRPPILPILAAVLLLAGCEGIFGGSGSGKESPLITELPRALTGSEQTAIRSGNGFGFELLRKVTAEKPETSVFISPFSASMALGMTMNGADGETFDGMRTALHFGTLSEEEINASYRGLIELLGTLDPRVQLSVGNAIWYREGIPIRSDFRDRVTTHFDARVEGLDFASPTAASTINQWVRDATRGKIGRIIDGDIPANMVTYLMNAVYFEAGWREPFDPQQTRDADFHLEDGSTAPIRLMTRTDTVQAHITERFAAADLPYAGGAWSMTVVVPQGSHTLDDLISWLGPEWWDELTASFRTGRAMVSLPRFELEWEGILNESLRAMGMEAAFDPGAADFSRMFEGGGPWIDEVKQKSYVLVDEEGTVAAAVTSVAMPTSMPPEIRADRPFLFAIRERLTGTILFLGAMKEAPPAIR